MELLFQQRNWSPNIWKNVLSRKWNLSWYPSKQHTLTVVMKRAPITIWIWTCWNIIINLHLFLPSSIYYIKRIRLGGMDCGRCQYRFKVNVYKDNQTDISSCLSIYLYIIINGVLCSVELMWLLCLLMPGWVCLQMALSGLLNDYVFIIYFAIQ